MDVGGWLRGLGLGQYEEQFRDNKIDADLLPRLTVDDLKDIGVSVVGDRRRLLDAIAVIAGAGRPADLPASPMKSAPSKGLSGIGRASSDHGNVLRPRRVHKPGREAGRRSTGATSSTPISRPGFWLRCDRSWRPRPEEARRRTDGAVRLSARPGERRRARRARAALAIQRVLSDLNARKRLPTGRARSWPARVGIECGFVVVEASGEVFGDVAETLPRGCRRRPSLAQSHHA